MSSRLSRRGLFSLFARSIRASDEGAKAVQALSGKAENSAPAADRQPRVAVIQGRFCLAYTSFCTVCAERCPVPGAMKVEKGIPMVVPDACIGCGVCRDVCPAPTNAVLVLPRRRIPRFTLPPTPPAAA